MDAPRAPAWLALVALLGAVASTAPVQGAEEPGSASWSIPDDLPGRTATITGGLDRIAAAEDVEQARSAHAEIADPLERTVPHTIDLAGRSGELLGTYASELEAQLAAGNLSDARSVAQAAANLLEDEIRPLVDRWDENRTVVAPGPARWSGDDLVVSIVLVNPPPEGLGAFDVELAFDASRPTGAHAATGQGETTVDPDNRTARVASFSAQALANLEKSGPRIVLGEVQLEPPDEGTPVNATAGVHELVTPDGSPVLALGLTGSSTVPKAPDGFDVGAWWPIVAVGAGAVGLVALVRRLEV